MAWLLLDHPRCDTGASGCQITSKLPRRLYATSLKLLPSTSKCLQPLNFLGLLAAASDHPVGPKPLLFFRSAALTTSPTSTSQSGPAALTRLKCYAKLLMQRSKSEQGGSMPPSRQSGGGWQAPPVIVVLQVAMLPWLDACKS